MASYTVVLTTAANVPSNTTSINSTKVKIVANSACVYAINAPATLTANVGAMIPANFPTYINMQGIGNRISILPVSGTSTAVTVTECGTVYQTAMNQNNSKGVFTMVNGSSVITGTTTGLNLGQYIAIAGSGIPFGATVSSFTSSNVTMSTTATANITATITFSVTASTTA
jgi:hypothetical protein